MVNMMQVYMIRVHCGVLVHKIWGNVFSAKKYNENENLAFRCDVFFFVGDE